jgi:hypothetical protein
MPAFLSSACLALGMLSVFGRARHKSCFSYLALANEEGVKPPDVMRTERGGNKKLGMNHDCDVNRRDDKV